MRIVERTAVRALPWLSAAGAIATTAIAAMKWNKLEPTDRTALGLDAVAYAVAILPLARRRSAGWRTLYLATIIQPVFAGLDLARNSPRWMSAIGRTVGTVVTATLLIRVRKNYE